MPESDIPKPHADDPYTKRELDHYFKEMRDTINEILFDVKEIKVQTTKTNGSVKEHKLYFHILWVGLGILGTTIIVLLPSILGFFKHIRAIDNAITDLDYQIDK